MAFSYAAPAVAPWTDSRWTNISRDEFEQGADEDLVAEADMLARRLLMHLGLPPNSQPLYVFGIRNGGDGSVWWHLGRFKADRLDKAWLVLHPGGTVSLKRPGCASAVPHKLSVRDVDVVRRLRAHVCSHARDRSEADDASSEDVDEIMGKIAALTRRLQMRLRLRG